MTDLLASFGGERFGTVVADPPWYYNPSHRFDPAHKGYFKYPCMTDDELAALPVKSLAHPDHCHLYLWCPSIMLESGVVLMRSWGFKLKTSLVWVKTTTRGNRFFGLGYYFHTEHELILFGTSGKRAFRGSKSLRTVLKATATGHSRKPEELQSLAEAMSPGPRLELFARRSRPGWSCWGNEVQTERGGPWVETRAR